MRHARWLRLILVAGCCLPWLLAGCGPTAPPASASAPTAPATSAAPTPDVMATASAMLTAQAVPRTPTRPPAALAPLPSPTTASTPTPAPSPTLAHPAPTRRADASPPPTVTAKYVAVLDEASGALLYGLGEHTRAAPASITKIVTTIVALERGFDLDQVIDISMDASEMLLRDGSQVMGLEPGERLKLSTLLYGMMLWSGNDAAEQVALSLGGTRERYVEWMNQKVEAVGVKDTRFVTPSGMDAPGHYSSAYDMAFLARDAMRHATFRTMAGTLLYTAEGYPMPNINAFLSSYPGADGIKTGFTDDAGRTLVASATRDDRRIYVTILNSNDLVGDATKLFDWVWQSHTWP